MMRFGKSWKPLAAPLLFLPPTLTPAQHYQPVNLVSDSLGVASVTDPNQKSAWGFTRSSGSPPWVGYSHSGTSTVYDGHGNPCPSPQEGGPLVVSVSAPGFAPRTQSAPTGVVFNSSQDFQVAPGKPASFLFATEDRTISDWNKNIGGTLFATCAMQDGPRHDPVGGAGLGFIELLTPSGQPIGHLGHGDWFHPPWGVVWTTRDIAECSNAILVGKFRSGWIAAFNGFKHKFIAFLRNPDDSIVTIDGLWSLTFANDGIAGLANALYFTAGINNEFDALFGPITPVDGKDGDEE